MIAMPDWIMVKTFTLFLVSGAGDPVQLNGFLTESHCEDIGRMAIERAARCKLDHVRCIAECFEGPPRLVPEGFGTPVDRDEH